MTKEEALEIALEALELSSVTVDSFGVQRKTQQAITAIKEALAQPAQEPLEYWNAVEGWVKIEEVREHFETVGCGTIYKTAGEGRVPVYTTPPAAQPAQDPDRQALQANGTHPSPCARHCEATAFNIVIRNLKAQLAQQAQESEPDELTIAYMSGFHDGKKKRPWVGLTDEEIEKGREQAFRWAENALKEKNS